MIAGREHAPSPPGVACVWARACSCFYARPPLHSPSTIRRSPAASSIRPQFHFGRNARRNRAEARRSRGEIRHPACRRHSELLEGQEIEPYANALFRSWQLGQKDKNNGVLLLVAPNDKRVRIEVGYGLEGTLTDALSKVIITNAITPRFKTGDFSGGHCARRRRHHHRSHHRLRGVAGAAGACGSTARRPGGPPDWLIIAAVIVFLGLMITWPGFRWFVLYLALDILFSSGSFERRWFQRRRLSGGGDRRVAAGLRGAGDAHFGTGPANA